MKEDCGILVINRDGKLLAANYLAELLLGRPLPTQKVLGIDSVLPRLLDRAGYPLERILTEGQEKHGLLKGDQLPEPGLWFTTFPLFDEANRVEGTVITLIKRDDEEFDHALKFLGLTHHELMDRLPEGVFMVNTRWQITYFNEAAQRITGLTKREVLGKFCWEVFRSDLCRSHCPMRVSMSTNEVLLDREVEILSKSGEKKVIVVNTCQIAKSENKVLGGLATFHECGCAETAVRETGRPIFEEIVGASPKMKEIFHRLTMIAASDSNVLIQGESGTGKELVARAVHYRSARRKGPFVAVNCSAIPENLLESELFGYERGAFTGAIANKPGRFELATGGTLFLDEIGDLKPHLQAKLLRVLEEKTFERVGGTRRIPLESRIIAATNIELKKAMRQGDFREDLYYRLFTVPVYMPPLRERRDDIPNLVKYFIERLNIKFNKKIKGVDPKVMKILCRYPWPGNVRELQHILEYCFVFARSSVITERHLPSMGTSWEERSPSWDSEDGPLQTVEKKAIIQALETTYGSKQDAARLLQISRSKLWRKMKAYNITEADFKARQA